MSDQHQLNIRVSAKCHAKLTEFANRAGMSVSAYARVLFDAAYAARAGVQSGDRDVDTNVSRVIVLWGAGVEPEKISKALGMSVGWVSQVIDAWRNEIRGRAA